MSDNTGYYLRTILRRLTAMQRDYTDAALDGAERFSWLGLEALSDEIEWLESYIESLPAPPAENEKPDE